jgi:heme oxygenase
MADRTASHEALRAGTAADHERLDALFGRFRLADAVDYRAFLTAQGVAGPVGARARDDAGFGARLADWSTRHRSAAIAADLAALGWPMPVPLVAPSLGTPAAQWGAAYVVEGSRLGGAMLARGVAEGLPKSYLGTPQAPGAWRHFLARLDEQLRSPEEVAAATLAAQATFALFEQAGRIATDENARP